MKQNSLPSAVLLALLPMVNFLLTPPRGKKVHTHRFIAYFPSLEVTPLPHPMNGSPAHSLMKHTIKHDYNVKEFPGITCTELLQSRV